MKISGVLVAVFMPILFTQNSIVQNSLAQTEAPEAASTAAPAVPVEEPDEDYQVDYEEAPDPELEAPTPSKKSNKKNKVTSVNKGRTGDKTTTTTGSRAKNRFVFPAKSETKSVYKKNGAPLDVDTD